ncbi:unnamed protein product [Psylliodes chrysocephalus]|uniref:Uncharacterized protein n=1 Tax=Psylliodes chrysocephalus TaxID=3402493 RepID=A0A9P0CYW8_9CUCU|nr:unnamed protein product [Psylliodes chrysocephala]
MLGFLSDSAVITSRGESNLNLEAVLKDLKDLSQVYIEEKDTQQDEEDEVYMPNISTPDCSDECPKIISSISVGMDLTVSVFTNDVQLSQRDLKWILPHECKLEEEFAPATVTDQPVPNQILSAENPSQSIEDESDLDDDMPLSNLQ